MTKEAKTGLIATKVGMARMADESGQMIPVTLLKIEDQKITKLLTGSANGYTGYQVGYAAKAEKNLTKADLGRLRKNNIEENFASFTEFRTSDELNVGDLGQNLTAELFKDVKTVDICGIVKGRGFQGAVRRWGAKIGRMTHGSRFHRRPGSLGMRSTPGRVFKNKHQPGQMGCNVKTIRNLSLVHCDVENNVLAVKGSVPGFSGGSLQVLAVH